jgi:peptidoglycan LD-endopeptidase CwlK
VRWSDCPRPGASGLHSRFNGIRWRYDELGIYVENSTVPERTSGEPTTCRAICELLADSIVRFSVGFGVPAEIVVMTIATEAAAYRATGFTGPPTFRWESHVTVKDQPPVFKGDYSVGPMQTLATTAREIIRGFMLPYDQFATFPVYRSQPPAPPTDIPSYEHAVNVHIGVAEIMSRWKSTGHDPILVSAAYNAGSIRQAPKSNRWHLQSHNNHLDRAAKWYGDACVVVGELRMG